MVAAALCPMFCRVTAAALDDAVADRSFSMPWNGTGRRPASACTLVTASLAGGMLPLRSAVSVAVRKV